VFDTASEMDITEIFNCSKSELLKSAGCELHFVFWANGAYVKFKLLPPQNEMSTCTKVYK